MLDINYFRDFLNILENYNPIDDEPMWAVDRVVTPTPGTAITIPKTTNKFAIKAILCSLMIQGSLKKFKKRSPEELKLRSEDTRRTNGNTTRNDPFPPFLILEAQTQVIEQYTARSGMDSKMAKAWFSTHLASLVKSWLVQDQTVLGKDYSNMLIADSLLKTIWFINAPCYDNEALASPKANELTVPEQTATGKGTSNPLMAGSLPKTTKST
ncbi:hypothetical protein Tco_1194370 [Tanacetum coccineum]